MSATPKFRKIESGLYGTGIWQTRGFWTYLWCPECADIEWDGSVVKLEWVVDRCSSVEQGWDLRQVCQHGRFADTYGGCWRTLGDAKADILDGALS